MAFSDQELDNLIKAEISKELSNIRVPDFNEQWSKIKEEIQTDDKPISPKRTKINRRLAIVASMLFISLSLAFLTPKDANAFGEKIIEFFNIIVGKTTNNKTEIYKQTGSPAEPVVTDLGTNNEKEVTLEQAQGTISYNLVKPNYLPPQFKLKRVLLTNMGPGISEVSIEYEGDNKIIVFKQNNNAKNTSRGSLYDTDDTTVKDVDIEGNPGFLLITKNNICTLNWSQGDLVLQITGKIDPEQIIKMAASIS